MVQGWLEGKTAVITGSGRGIGRGIALLMAKEGANVVVNDPGVNLDGTGSDASPADQVVSEIRAAGGKAVPDFESVASVEGGEAIIKTALDAFGKVDILVNVAGILRDRMIFNMTPDEWYAVLNTHLKGHYCMIKPASILMRQQGSGRIINFSSSSGLTGKVGQANYGAAKSAIAGLTRVVARDLGRYGVTCNAIAPDAATRMTESVPDSTRERVGSGPMLADPEDIAPMVCFLASDYAWNVNGQVFAVSGGNVSILNHPSGYRSIYKPGMWSLDELDMAVPSILAETMNPAPPAEDLQIPGRSEVTA